MKSYAEKKAQARDEATCWQHNFEDTALSMSELAEAGAHFEKLGKRYGLLKEFRENGIL